MRRAILVLCTAVAVPSFGCPSSNPVECRDNTSCDLAPGGVCTVAPAGSQWCAYPDPACPGGLRYSDFHTGDGLGGTCVTSAADAGVDATDATIDATPRRWSQPQSAAFNVADKTDTMAKASPSATELYFAAPPPGEAFVLDIFYATRAGPSFTWGASRTAVGAINSTQSESEPCPSADGLELYFRRGATLYVSKRGTPAAAWGPPVSTGLDGSFPDILADGLAMYYFRNSAACPVDTCRLKVTRANSSAPWGNPVVESIRDGELYQFVDVSGDGLRALLSGPSGPGVAPVVIASRTNLTAPWGPPGPIAELALYTGIRWAHWSWDETEMYLGFTTGANDVFVSRLE